MSILAMVVAASLTIGASGTDRQVVVTTIGGAGERTTNTEYGVFLNNTSGILVKRGTGCAVFTRDLGNWWKERDRTTTVIVEEGNVILPVGTKYRIGPDTYRLAGTVNGLRFYSVTSALKPVTDEAGVLAPTDGHIDGCETCLNLGSGESVDIGGLSAANRAALSLVKWRQVSGEWIEQTGYYGWTTNAALVCTELGGPGAQLEARPEIRAWNQSAMQLETTTIPGLDYCIVEYDELDAAPVVTNASVKATGETLELAVPALPEGRTRRFYRVRAAD